MGIFSRRPKFRNGEPDVRFASSDGLILFDEWAEHRLFSPSLELMLQRYLDHPESRSRAREWLAEANQYYPFGFASLCENLDLDADYVRRGLIRWMNKIDSDVALVATRSEVQHFKVPTPHVSPLILRSRSLAR
jgi:hypothetical protein